MRRFTSSKSKVVTAIPSVPRTPETRPRARGKRAAILPGRTYARPDRASRGNEGRGRTALEDAGDRARRMHRADDDGQAVLARQREGRGVHDAQVAGDRLVVAERI